MPQRNSVNLPRGLLYRSPNRISFSSKKRPLPLRAKRPADCLVRIPQIFCQKAAQSLH